MRSRALLLLLAILVIVLAPTVLAQSTGIEQGLQNLAKSLKQGFENATNTVLDALADFVNSLKDILVKLSQIVSLGLALVGCFLWFSGISPYSGKRMVISAALLFAFAYVLKHLQV